MFITNINLFLVIIACVLNQSKGHWLLNDTLNTTISMNVKLKEKVNNLCALDHVLINDDLSLDIDLGTFART
jgi:hypothetical protein